MNRWTTAAALVLTGALSLVGCTTSLDEPVGAPTTTTSASNQPPPGSEPSSGPDSDAPDALLDRAVDQLHQAPAVGVDVTASVIQSTNDSTTTSTGSWMSDPLAWRIASTREASPDALVDTYTLDALYRDGGSYLRLTEDDEKPGPWGEDGRGFAFVPHEYLENYPVAPILEATFVDAVTLSDVTVVSATVPNEVITLWFGLEAFLTNHGQSGVLEGGESQVSITIDESGFPIKLTCAGSGITLNDDIPAYVAQDLAESRLTMYFEPIDVPELLRQR